VGMLKPGDLSVSRVGTVAAISTVGAENLAGGYVVHFRSADLAPDRFCRVVIRVEIGAIGGRASGCLPPARCKPGTPAGVLRVDSFSRSRSFGEGHFWSNLDKFRCGKLSSRSRSDCDHAINHASPTTGVYPQISELSPQTTVVIHNPQIFTAERPQSLFGSSFSTGEKSTAEARYKSRS
jgi:hypothetical protein